MHRTVSAFAIALLTAACASAPHASTLHPSTAAPAWTSLERGLARSAETGRPLLLSLQADWCHWCHVMNETTYRDPEVLALLETGFVVAREEADARPDLAERYAEYGWPATIVIAPDGTELLALRGHRAPPVLLALLRGVVDGEPVGAVAIAQPTAPAPLDVVHDALLAQLEDQYDEAMGGWGTPQKYPFAAPIELTFARATRTGDEALRQRALFTLAHEAELVDPVWGGMYQYSEHGDWSHPHYERIAAVQAAAIEGFALALRATGEPIWAERADAIVRYLRAFLRRSDGALYASQDADLRRDDGTTVLGAAYAAHDDAERRAMGIPRIDTRVFASTDGTLITALARLAEVAPQLGTLDDARRAADAVIAELADEHHLFRHARTDGDARFLADQVAMIRALLALDQAGGGARYRALARRTLDATLATLTGPDGASLSSRTASTELHGALATPRAPAIENALAATALVTFATLEEDPDRASADAARARAVLEALGGPRGLAPLGRKVGEILLAIDAVRGGLVRFSIVGDAADARTTALDRAVLAADVAQRVVERSAPGEGRYPSPGHPVVYVCALDRCSFPLEDPTTLAADVAAFLTPP